MNKDKREELPPDLQAIVLEEAAKVEMEMLRLGAIQNEVGLLKNVEVGGMEYTEFSPELRAKSDQAVIQGVIPNWADRVGLDSPWIGVFNESSARSSGTRSWRTERLSRCPKSSKSRGLINHK